MGYWIVNTAGIGSIIVFAVGFSVLAAYFYMLRWIQTTPPDPAVENNRQEQEEETQVTEAGDEKV
jgi:hypothetical protein